jgi:hypothetical protein
VWLCSWRPARLLLYTPPFFPSLARSLLCSCLLLSSPGGYRPARCGLQQEAGSHRPSESRPSSPRQTSRWPTADSRLSSWPLPSRPSPLHTARLLACWLAADRSAALPLAVSCGQLGKHNPDFLNPFIQLRCSQNINYKCVKSTD